MSKNKSWNESRAEIERVLDSEYNVLENELSISNGIQHKHTISHLSSVITCITFRGSPTRFIEYYVANCISADGSKSFLIQWKYDYLNGTYKVVKKVVIGQCLKLLTWIPGQNAFVGYSEDMTLRGYAATFQEKSKMNVNSSVLCMLYLEEYDEFITGGQGFVYSWNMKLIDYGFLVEIKEPPLKCDVVSTREWVIQLYYDKFSKTLMALTDESVYLISLKYRKQIQVFHNTHKFSLTYCAFYRPLLYFITAARDGTVHIYHTGLQSVIRTFSAHLDGLTGIVTLSQQPILISWSHRSGNMRMWRLDTFEMSHQISMSQIVRGLFLPRDDRMFYFAETEVQIFSVNVLYSIFSTLTSSIESIKLISIRRKSPKQSSNVEHPRSPKRLASSKTLSQLQRVDSKSPTSLPGSGSFVQSSQNNQFNKKKPDTFLDERLVCLLDDHCLVSVSPMNGVVLGIIFPPVEANDGYSCINAHHAGNTYYTTLPNGSFLEFDTSVNPANLSTLLERGKKDEKIISVCCMEIYIDEGSQKGKRMNATFFGLDNGTIILYNKKQDKKKKKLIGKAPKRKSTSQLSLGESLTMNPFRAHQGDIIMMQGLVEGSVFIKDERIEETVLKNMLLTFGGDQKLVIWKISVHSGANQHSNEIVFHKLQNLKLDNTFACTAVADNVLLCGFNDGKVEMYDFKWKYFVSDNGARISIECNSVILSPFKKTVIDKDLYHKSAVTAASGSMLLGIFLSVGKDSLIKIWNNDGHMIRELHLGDVVQTACFRYGYNLLVGLHNHLALVEAKSYLPVEYLEILLKLDKQKKIKDFVPENPVLLKDVSKSKTSILVQKKQEPLQNFRGSFGVSESEMLDTEQEEPIKINHVLRYLRSRKTFLTESTESVNTEDDEVVTNVFSGIKLKDYPPIVQIVDKSQDFLSEIEIERMKKYPVGPDGEIPNSVIRDKVTPIHDQRVLRGISGQLKSETIQLNVDKKKRNLYFRRLPLDELSVEVSEENVPEGESTSEQTSLSKKQVLELSDRVKWEMKDDYQEKQVEKRFGSKLPSHLKKEVVKEIKQAQETKKIIQKQKSEAKQQSASEAMEKLLNLLKTIQNQRWCSHIMTVDTFAESFTSIAHILNQASHRIALEICRLLNQVLDVCVELKVDDNYSKLFDVELQKKFLPQLGAFLFSSIEPLQVVAAEILSKFDDKLLLMSIMNDVVPKFFTESLNANTKTINPNLSNVVGVVKNLSDAIDTDRLRALCNLIDVESYRDEVKDENKCVDEMVKALALTGVDLDSLKMWANLALPILSDRGLPPEFVMSRQLALSSSQILQLPVNSSELRETASQRAISDKMEADREREKARLLKDQQKQVNEKIDRKASRDRIKKLKMRETFKQAKQRKDSLEARLTSQDVILPDNDSTSSLPRRKSLSISTLLKIETLRDEEHAIKQSQHQLRMSDMKELMDEKPLSELSLTLEPEPSRQSFRVDDSRETSTGKAFGDGTLYVEHITLKQHESDDDDFITTAMKSSSKTRKVSISEQQARRKESLSIMQARRKSSAKASDARHARRKASSVSKKSDVASMYKGHAPQNKQMNLSEITEEQESQSFLPQSEVTHLTEEEERGRFVRLDQVYVAPDDGQSVPPTCNIWTAALSPVSSVTSQIKDPLEVIDLSSSKSGISVASVSKTSLSDQGLDQTHASDKAEDQTHASDKAEDQAHASDKAEDQAHSSQAEDQMHSSDKAEDQIEDVQLDLTVKKIDSSSTELQLPSLVDSSKVVVSETSLIKLDYSSKAVYEVEEKIQTTMSDSVILQPEITVDNLHDLPTSQYCDQTITLQDLKQPSTSQDLIQLSTSQDLEHPPISQDLQEPSTSEDLKELSTLQDPQQPFTSQDLKHPSTSEDLKQLSTPQDLQQPSTSQDLKLPSTFQDLKQPSTSQDLKHPSTSEDLIQLSTSHDLNQMPPSQNLTHDLLPTVIIDKASERSVGKSGASLLETISDTEMTKLAKTKRVTAAHQTYSTSISRPVSPVRSMYLDTMKNLISEKRFSTEKSFAPKSSTVVFENKYLATPSIRIHKPKIAMFTLDDTKSGIVAGESHSADLRLIKVTKSISFEDSMLPSYDDTAHRLLLPGVKKSESCEQFEQRSNSVISLFKKRAKGSARLKKPSNINAVSSNIKEELLPRRLHSFILQHGGDNIPDKILHPKSWRDILSGLRFVRIRSNELVADKMDVMKEKSTVALPKPLTSQMTRKRQYQYNKCRDHIPAKPSIASISSEQKLSFRRSENNNLRFRTEMELPSIKTDFAQDKSDANALASSRFDSYFNQKLNRNLSKRLYTIPHKAVKDEMALLHKRLGQYFNVFPQKSKQNYSTNKYPSYESYHSMVGVDDREGKKTRSESIINKQDIGVENPPVKVRYKWKHSVVNSSHHLPSLM